MTDWLEIGPCKLACGDSLEILPEIAAGSIDCVVTDPPYLREYVHLYEAMAERLPRVCREGAFVYAYAGAEVLPQVIAGMTKYLTWFWLCNIQHRGGTARLWYKRLMVTSKPVVVCTVGLTNQDSLRWCAIDYNSGRKSKNHNHPWEQDITFPVYVAEMRTEEGQTILDPFMGSGTTGVACIQTGRRFIGIEISPQYFDIACRRIRNACENRQGKLF